MFRKLFATDNDIATTIARVVLGCVFFPHGAQKALGWFGGPGFSGALKMFESMQIPPWLGVLAIAAEFLGGIALVVGLLSRVAALGIAVNMIVAVVLVPFKNGFFMNWMGNQAGEGFEYHLLAIALALVVILRGGGAASLDRIIAGSGGVRANGR